MIEMKQNNIRDWKYREILLIGAYAKGE